MVILDDIEVYSLCEHRIFLFSGKALIAYVHQGQIDVLISTPRIVDVFARGL